MRNKPTDKILEKLAEELFYQLERIDPSYDERQWSVLDDAEKDVYILALMNVLIFKEKDIFQYFEERKNEQKEINQSYK